MCDLIYDSVAQLGERYLDRVEVAGSSPVGITTGRSLKSLFHKGFELLLFLHINHPLTIKK